MYVPVLKNRKEEMKVLKDLNYCFGDDIIPLIEIINDFYLERFKMDEETGMPIKVIKEGNKRATKVKLEPTQEDIITIDLFLSILNGQKAFIDYFRYSSNEYERNVNIEDVKLARRLSEDYFEYKNRILDLSNYNTLIPVLSFKDNFPFDEDLVKLVQTSNAIIGLRIRDSIIYDCLERLPNLLRENDYLIFDIGNNNINSKVMEIEEIINLNLNCKKIIINCQRNPKMKNGEFPDCSKTMSMDTSLIINYRVKGFDGFGDYCGYKDALPLVSRTRGEGAALAILYNFSDNSFYSFVNYQTKDGLRGYYNVVQKIFDYCPNVMGNYDNCPAFNKIRRFGIGKTKYGTWGNWNNIAMTRYISQIFENKKAI